MGLPPEDEMRDRTGAARAFVRSEIYREARVQPDPGVAREARPVSAARKASGAAGARAQWRRLRARGASPVATLSLLGLLDLLDLL